MGKKLFRVIQQWEGVVESIDKHFFYATLSDLTDKSQPKSDATFPLALVHKDDKALVEPGALFYLSIGQGRDTSGNIIDEHNLKFRRIFWTRQDVIEMEERAKEWAELLSQ